MGFFFKQNLKTGSVQVSLTCRCKLFQSLRVTTAKAQPPLRFSLDVSYGIHYSIRIHKPRRVLAISLTPSVQSSKDYIYTRLYFCLCAPMSSSLCTNVKNSSSVVLAGSARQTRVAPMRITYSIISCLILLPNSYHRIHSMPKRDAEVRHVACALLKVCEQAV